MLKMVVWSTTFQREIAQHILAPGTDPAIGGWGDETFELRFYSDGPTYQVCVGIDGRAVVSGPPRLWNPDRPDGGYIVEHRRDGRPGLVLSAWPEDDQGGRRFVLTSSVATHGVGERTITGPNPWAKTIMVAVWEETATPVRPIIPVVVTWEQQVNVFMSIQRPHDHHYGTLCRALEVIGQCEPDLRDYQENSRVWSQFLYEAGKAFARRDLSNYDLYYELRSIAGRVSGLVRLLDQVLAASEGRAGHENSPFKGSPLGDRDRGGQPSAPTMDVMRSNNPGAANPYAPGHLGAEVHRQKRGEVETVATAHVTPDIGVGAGARTEQRFTPAAALLRPVYKGAFGVRILWWERLCDAYDEIEAAAKAVATRHLPALPVAQAYGAPVPGMDLGGVPSVEAAQPVPGTIPGQAKHGRLTRLVA